MSSKIVSGLILRGYNLQSHMKKRKNDKVVLFSIHTITYYISEAIDKTR